MANNNQSEGLPQYPFVDAKEFRKDFWGLLKDYAIYNVIDAVKPSYKTRERSKGMNALGRLLDSQELMYEQSFFEKKNRIFPKLAAWNRFSKGASKIDRLYTVEMYGIEMPVFMSKKGDEDPTDEILTENIRSAKRDKESVFNQKKMILNLYDDKFSDVAAEKYSRSDMSKREDPYEFRNYFIRDDSWLIQQYGKRDEKREKEIDVDGERYQIKVYMKPSRWRNWLYWAIGDKIYDIIDAPFDPIQKRAEKNMTPDARQIMLREEYKVITSLIRALMRSRSPQLDYEARGVFKYGAADDYALQDDTLKKAA
jgi:hypothetical protein